MASFSTNYSAALGNILSQVNDAFSGKTSGIDVSSVVDSMMQVQDQPETQMKDEQSSLDAQISALTTNDLAAMSTPQVASFTTAQINVMNISQVTALFH